MCDTVAGQLILSFAFRDPAGKALIEQIREGLIEHVSYLAGMRERLAALHLKVSDHFPFDFHLVEVPDGAENWKANYLQFFYKQQMLSRLHDFGSDDATFDALRRSDRQFTVTPNHLLSLAGPAGGGVKPSAKSFTFDPLHQTYRAMVGMAPSPSTGAGVTIAVLDSGIAPDHAVAVLRHRNFVDPTPGAPADDDHGHGTVVSRIIGDLVPDARQIVYKIADAAGRASEWDTVAALAGCSDADVVNLSVQFGLGDRPCQVCGRESHSSRAAVFEFTLAHYPATGRDPVFVAAAGNKSHFELAYPARFGSAVAVGALTSTYALSSESNYGELDHEQVPHLNRFVMPGGEPGPAGAESVGSFGTGGVPWHGTSLACAYATAVVACRLALMRAPVTASTILPSLRAGADTASLTPHDPRKHGNGVARA